MGEMENGVRNVTPTISSLTGTIASVLEPLDAPISTSIAPAKKIMGPNESISSCHCKCHGPIRGHQQQPPKKLWAQTNQSAAAIVNAMGPFKGIDSTCRRNYGPKQ